MKNNDKIIIKSIDTILKDIGSYKPCKGWNPDCAQCKIYVLVGYLEWFHELLDETKWKKK